MGQRGHRLQEQVDEESTATHGEEQAEDPLQHGEETATRSVEEASSTGRAVVTCEAEHSTTSQSAMCRVEERAP